MRRHLAATLLLLALPAAPAPAAEPAPRAYVDALAERYRTMPHYRFEGVLHVSASGAALPQAQSMDVAFRYAAVRPTRLLMDNRNPVQATLAMSDGESLWVSVPALGQYTVQKLKAPAAGEVPEVQRQFDTALFFADGVARSLAGARDVGRDTVHTAAGPVDCRRLELTYAADTTRPGLRLLPRILWVDTARDLVLRDSTTLDEEHPQYGPLHRVQDTRYVLAETRQAPDRELFRFAPPDGARRVRRIGQQPAEDENVGKPAKDFTLAVLDGKGRKVSLAAQKGSVVVLDFWATWCGPCRRWMPIVEKLEKETAAKGVKFFAVNLHEPLATVREYVTKQKVHVPVLLDVDGAVGTAYGARSIPLTVVVGRDGRIVRTLLGVHPEEDLREALREAGVEGL